MVRSAADLVGMPTPDSETNDEINCGLERECEYDRQKLDQLIQAYVYTIYIQQTTMMANFFWMPTVKFLYAYCKIMSLIEAAVPARISYTIFTSCGLTALLYTF